MLTVAGGVVLGWIVFAVNLPAPRRMEQLKEPILKLVRNSI
jgi:hypothetical protein